MADTYIKISELEETTLADDSSYIPIDNGNHTYKISVENYNSGANATAQSYAEAAAASADDAETAKTAAETAETETGLIHTATQQYATAASGSASAAASSAVDALNYADSAASAAANAADSAQDAAESYTNAAEKAVLSESWAVGGTNTRTGEDTNNSQYYAAVATSAAENAEDQVELANAASTAASGSAVDAAASATEASGYADDASDYATAASGSATAAATSATQSANSAGAAATSATNAAASATAASGSASTATTQANNAAQSATTAGGYATQAASSASDASGYATNAANSATAAAGSATTASNQATAAAGSATAAAASASDAADSAADAAESAATFTTDDTLSIAGKAADAKAAGDMIAAVQAEIPELDNWLTTPGAAAEAKHTGDRISEVEDDVADLKSALIEIDDYAGSMTLNAYITTNVTVRDTVDTTPVSNTGFKYIIIPVANGDTFRLTLRGGVAPKAWALTDNAYKLLSKENSITVTDKLVEVSQEGFLIANCVINDFTAKIEKISYFNAVNAEARIDANRTDIDANRADIDAIQTEISNVTHITDPHLLVWRMGVFTASGPQSYTQGILPTDRFFTIVRLKKGSTVSKKSSVSRTRLISFGYKLSEDDATLSGYTNDAGASLTIDQDCIAYIGIRYSQPVEALPNDNILDTFDFSLDVIDYESRYNRSQGIGGRYYGFPCPEIYYEGQHTDTTGWDNSMSSIQAVYDAFDALCTASNGYLKQTQDYGVAYTGNADNELYDADSEWHLYGYTAKPSQADNAIKIAITCCLHGNEKMSVYAMYYLMYDLIHNATKNPVLSYLKSNCIIRFIPICNPYGFMKAVPSRVNENSVNLNRNFPTYNWSDYESGEGTLNYKGASAGSETETQLIMKFFRDNYDAVFSVDLHTNGADTQARDQISAFMPAMPTDKTDVNYQIQHDFLLPGMSYTRRLKPWMNEQYDAGLPFDYAWGNVIAMGDFPSAPEWIRQTVGTVGLCYEVLAGSSNGYIGPDLTVYGADTIKFAAEELGMMLTTVAAHCKDLK